ncbi:hypothetical protein DOTSEDRAFT_68123 [Dothistroma septosporum NZE10]|uniref:Actin cytoskeleton-regulatory complex protein SLA1 n=1 Tax=Dothistroma septosporum (strain NZE10 / CBS 128990) TaxID=675120 RepID=N1Q0E8_DOTSN|nr:hypothetical protein DOTSEDRAFT_68123 [Dothistroma septosporum NZE10]
MPFESVVRAVYDYQPQSEEELEIREGDLLFVLEKSADDDWWKCKKKATDDDDEEPEGLVPNNYVEDVRPAYQAKALYDYTKQTDEELSFKEDVRLDVYDDTDPDWTLVGSHGEFGFAPAIYIERVEATSVVQPARSLGPAPPPMPARPPAADEPIPGEADYLDPAAASIPSPDPTAHNPAAQLAGIIAQRTGGTQPSPTVNRALASPPLPSRPQYTPEESDEEAAPSLPQRPASQTIPISPPPPPIQYASRGEAQLPRISSPSNNRVATSYDDENGDDELRSPGSFHLYNVHEMIQHMGKNKKMPTILGINIGKGVIMISPEKSRDGPSKEWTADKLTHYSIEGKHVFVELVRPSKSIDFHAGAKDTAQEIVSALGELAGAVRQEGLREVLAAGAGAGAAGKKRGQMLYEFMAQGEDEVTVGVGDEVVILDDTRSEEWWVIRRMKNGKEGVVPSSYVEITGRIPDALDSITGLDTARSTVEQNRLEEQRLAREAVKRDKRRDGDVVPPERHSSLAGDTRRTSMRSSKSKEQSKSKPNSSRVRTWTDRTGSFKVEAEFIGLREGKIHLHKMNGVKIAVPVSKMAVEDLEYVEAATGASLDEDKPLSDIKRRNTQRSKATGQGGTAGATVQKKNEYDWFDFFLQCGVNPQICERYAGAFSRDQMTPEVLPDVTDQLLRTLGLKEGDILRVMKYLDIRYDRISGAGGSNAADGSANGVDGGLFSGPGGALRNNTRKGRPAPAVQTNDVVDESAFKPKGDSAVSRDLPSDAKATPLATAPARQATSGFDDDAWDVKPARSQPSTSSAVAAPLPPTAEQPKAPGPKINEDLVSLSISSPALEPTPATPATPSQPVVSQQTAAQQPQTSQPPPVANQAIFDKIASLAPANRQQQPMQTGYQQPLEAQQTALPRQRPAAPQQLQQGPGASLNMPPPPRAASAPGFPPQQSQFAATPLQPQLTGYPAQQFQPLQSQQTSFQSSQGHGQSYQQPNAMQPQITSMQAMQQNYPSLQPHPTGFQPQSQFGQQVQQLGMVPTGYQQQLVNGAQTGSPFADPPRQQFQPMPSGLSNSFSPQQTGFQPSFNISQPTGMNGFGAQPTQPAPQLPPQQTGGVFGPSQPLGAQAPPMPLIPQKTGPPPPVRFGVQPGAKPLAPQPTGRANLAKATPQNPFGF